MKYLSGESMGYLICDKCRGYYELQKGESAEDFDKCQCGGKLRYVNNLDEYPNDDQYLTEYSNIKEAPFETDEDEPTSKENPTSAMDVIYEETIYLTWLIIVFILILGGVYLTQSLVPDDQKPAMNLVFIIVVLAAFFTANFLILRIKITQEYLSVSFGLFKQIMHWEEINNCYVDEPPAWEFNGYGIRYTRINGRRVQGYVMGSPKVIISLNQGKYPHFVFTTRNPQEVCSLIKDY
jgi:hypothetical protein